jgi:hypothetical protein
MDGLMKQLLIDHFSNPDNIEHVEFRNKVWKREKCDSGILIEIAPQWEPITTEKRPAVIIKRNDWTNIKRGTLSNVSGSTAEGDLRYTKFMKGSHTLFCISKKWAEAEILAAEVYRHMMHYSPVFRQYFTLMMFELVQIGQLHEIEECEEHWAVPVTVSYAWEETWILRQHAPRLKVFRMSQLMQIGS